MLQQQFTEGRGSVLTASVRMEDEMIAGLSSFQRSFESCSHKLCAGLCRYFVCDHFSGKQVENGAEVICFVLICKLRAVAYPYKIGRFCSKILSQHIVELM